MNGLVALIRESSVWLVAGFNIQMPQLSMADEREKVRRILTGEVRTTDSNDEDRHIGHRSQSKVENEANHRELLCPVPESNIF